MEGGKYRVSKQVHISRGKITLGSQEIFDSSEDSFSEFSKQSYQALGLDYPKFFKMDGLSKMSLLAGEVLGMSSGNWSRERRGLLFANASSSLAFDRKHQFLLDSEQAASPSVFVYTLPNVCMGEMSIRFGICDEQCFFVEENTDLMWMFRESLVWLEQGLADQIWVNWVEQDGEEYSCNSWFVEQNQNEKVIQKLDLLTFDFADWESAFHKTVQS